MIPPPADLCCLASFAKLRGVETIGEFDFVPDDSPYPYQPTHVLLILFACIVSPSLALHIWQNL